jgi:hypothetical protein
MHRAAPASRAFGRYAVGLPADPGHRRLTRRAQTTANNGQTTTNTTTQRDLTGPAPSGMTTKRARSGTASRYRLCARYPSRSIVLDYRAAMQLADVDRALHRAAPTVTRRSSGAVPHGRDYLPRRGSGGHPGDRYCTHVSGAATGCRTPDTGAQGFRRTTRSVRDRPGGPPSREGRQGTRRWRHVAHRAPLVGERVPAFGARWRIRG